MDILSSSPQVCVCVCVCVRVCVSVCPDGARSSDPYVTISRIVEVCRTEDFKDLILKQYVKRTQTLKMSRGHTRCKR